MDDSFFVGRTETATNLLRVFDRFAWCQCPLDEWLSERLPFEQFRNDKWGVLESPDVENGEDVRMIQCTGGTRFLFKSAETIRTQINRRQTLDRNIAPKGGVVRTIHLTHATGADERANLVSSELCADRNVHGIRMSREE